MRTMVSLKGLLVALSLALTLTACSYQGDSQDNYQERQEAELEYYFDDSEAQYEQYQNDYFEEELIQDCIDASYGDFYSEDELISYCEDNAYDYFEPEPDYYEPDYYEPDFYEPDYDYGYRY